MPTAVTLALVVNLSSVGGASAIAEPPKLGVALFDYAGLPPDSLSRARSELVRIYRDIGVDVLWHDSTELTGQTLLILIRARSAGPRENLPQTIVGLTSGTAGERGRVAQVFFDRVEQLPVAHVHRPTLLGHVMAHELAHLLLPLESHSPQGLMRARWDRSDLERALEGRLRFTPEHARLIRSRLSDASR